jgi:hypothetical protein
LQAFCSARAATGFARTKYVITSSKQIKPGAIALSNISPAAQKALGGPGLHLHLVRHTSPASSAQSLYGFALCNPGEVPIGGGGGSDEIAGASDYLLGSSPIYRPDSQNNGWQILVHNGDGAIKTVTTEVMCVATTNPVQVTGP